VVERCPYCKKYIEVRIVRKRKKETVTQKLFGEI